MSQATVRIPTPLRSFTGGAAEVTADGATVGEVLTALTRAHDGIAERILDGEGKLRSFVNVYLNDTNVKSLDALDTAVGAGAVVHIVPAVAGGAR